MGAHLALVGVAADSERHCAHARQPGVPVQDPGQRVLEGGTVVDARAHDDLSVHLDPPVQQHLEPAQAGRSLWVAQHLRPQLGIRGVDGDEERAQPLGQDPLGVELGEAGQGGEVPVEERQAVVVVLEVEAPPHPLGQLVDETERTVVVAGPDPVEDGRGDLDPEGLSRRLVDPDQPGQRRPGAAHQDAEVAASLRRWKSMTSRGSCPFRLRSSSPTASPARAAGDAAVTEVTVGADMALRLVPITWTLCPESIE